MIERKQYFGYRCKVVDHEYDEYWCGVVCVPKWHPVRSVGLDDLLVILFEGDWYVFIDGDYSFFVVSNKCWRVASTLRRMQDDWDRLSPCEREYVVR